MRKLIYFLYLFLFTTNLKAVEEIKLQWEDITPPAGFTPRYIQIDDNDNMYGLLGNRIFFYEYATNNWTTQNLPVGVDINKVIDFDVDENNKAYFVIEGSSQFLIYDLNSKEITYLDLPEVEGYKYWYTFKIKNSVILYNIVNENLEIPVKLSVYNTRNSNNKILEINYFNIPKFLNLKNKNQFVANKEWIYDLISDELINFDFINLPQGNTGFNSYKFLFGHDNENNMYLNNAKANDGNTIILYKTSDFGQNWQLVSEPEIDCIKLCEIKTGIQSDNYIVIVGRTYDGIEDNMSIAVSIDKGVNWSFTRIKEFGEFKGFPGDWWGTKNQYIPIDQNIYITKNNELIVYSQERMLKTDLKKITSVENEATPPLKNLSVLYGNISENILNINIESGISSNAKVSLYSSDMKEIEQFSNVEFLQGKNELTFNINTTLSTGAYYVFIESGNYKHFYRIIKN